MTHLRNRSVSGLLKEVFSPLTLAIWGVVSVTVAVAGPFGTFSQFDLFTRLLYWSIVVGVSVVVGRSVRVLMGAMLAGRPIWLVETFSLCIMVPILTVVISLISHELPNVAKLDVPSVACLGLFVFFVAVSLVVLRSLWGMATRENAAEHGSRPRLMERLPAHLQGDVVRLSGKGHLVEVVTKAGTGEVRMRFADAAREMEPVPGCIAHRSHWVAREAIAGVERNQGRIFLILYNGDHVPVGRKYRSALEDAGIL